jgi:hypothetical protein
VTLGKDPDYISAVAVRALKLAARSQSRVALEDGISDRLAIESDYHRAF